MIDDENKKDEKKEVANPFATSLSDSKNEFTTEEKLQMDKVPLTSSLESKSRIDSDLNNEKSATVNNNSINQYSTEEKLGMDKVPLSSSLESRSHINDDINRERTATIKNNSLDSVNESRNNEVRNLEQYSTEEKLGMDKIPLSSNLESRSHINDDINRDRISTVRNNAENVNSKLKNNESNILNQYSTEEKLRMDKIPLESGFENQINAGIEDSSADKKNVVFSNDDKLKTNQLEENKQNTENLESEYVENTPISKATSEYNEKTESKSEIKNTNRNKQKNKYRSYKSQDKEKGNQEKDGQRLKFTLKKAFISRLPYKVNVHGKLAINNKPDGENGRIVVPQKIYHSGEDNDDYENTNNLTPNDAVDQDFKEENENPDVKPNQNKPSKNLSVPVKDKSKEKGLVKGLMNSLFFKKYKIILLIAIGIIFLILLIVIICISGGGIQEEMGNLDTNCNYNITRVNYSCNDISKNVSIDNFVLGSTYAYTLGSDDFSTNAIKALMIAIKTTTLSQGGYNNDTKNVSIDCSIKYVDENSIPENILKKYQNYYNNISDYLFISESYNDSITSLSSDSILPINDEIIEKFKNSEKQSYLAILKEIYNENENDNDNSFKQNIYIGDSRIAGMNNVSIVNDNNSAFRGANGYCWFSYNTSYSNGCSPYYAGNTNDNSALGGINLANQKMASDQFYNIIIWLGVNDLGNLNNYFNTYKGLAENEWENHNIYIVQVGPVNEAMYSLNSYNVKNSQVEQFNNDMAKLIKDAAISNLKYLDLGLTQDSINWDDTDGVHYIKSDYQKIYDAINNNLGNSSHKELYNLREYCNLIDDSSNLYCDAGINGDLVTFIAGWECNGGIDGCPYTCTIDGQEGWWTADLHDNAITIGPGMTNCVINGRADVASYIDQNGWGKFFTKNGNTYSLTLGLCIPKEVVKKLQLYVLETQFGKAVEQAMEKYDVELTQFQKDALTSLGYTHGAYKYTNQLVKAYKDGGYEGLWSVMKNCIKSGYETAFRKRSKGEFALFVTGDYSDQNLFYSRNTSNYDNYNSENVMGRALKCGGTSGYIFPLDPPETRDVHCSSPYGYRNHPTQGVWKKHSGLDLGTACGSPIYASKSGTVTYASPNGGTLPQMMGSGSAGNTVIIKHEDGQKTQYMHMQAGSIIVHDGDTVRQGQKIGLVGTTGDSTGCHLHISFYAASGETLDPYDFIGQYLNGVDGVCHK